MPVATMERDAAAVMGPSAKVSPPAARLAPSAVRSGYEQAEAELCGINIGEVAIALRPPA